MYYAQMESHGKSGPRPKPLERRLRNRVTAHLTDEEYARLMKHVNETGADGISTVVRALIVKGLG